MGYDYRAERDATGWTEVDVQLSAQQYRMVMSMLEDLTTGQLRRIAEVCNQMATADEARMREDN